MKNRPNPDAPDCGCKWFERAAKDKMMPVVFDELMNTYHILHNEGRGRSIFYHCPFCGGKAPKSLSPTYWTEVSHEESRRLQDLSKNILTAEELFAAFGPPDNDFDPGGSFTTAGTQAIPPETTLAPRRVTFKSLSDTIDVHVSINRYGRLRFSYTGRYIGPKRSEQAGASDGDKPTI
jgi:hypothetical protein